jgi:hypothetical protein
VFFRSDGSMSPEPLSLPYVLITAGQRMPLVVINTLVWKPFDSRFEDLLNDLKFHRELLESELNLWNSQTMHAKMQNVHDISDMVIKELEKAAEERRQAHWAREIHRYEQNVSDQMKRLIEEELKGRCYQSRLRRHRQLIALSIDFP